MPCQRGFIHALIPAALLTRFLGAGVTAMLIMLGVGIPLYVCATASTPIAAALILKGVSPGAALVFLLAGPATNVASLSMVLGILGRRGTAIYLSSIAVVGVLLGLCLDAFYAYWGLSAMASAGEAAELVPPWARISGAIALLVLSAGPVARSTRKRLFRLLGRKADPFCGEARGGTCPTQTFHRPDPADDHASAPKQMW